MLAAIMGGSVHPRFDPIGRRGKQPPRCWQLLASLKPIFCVYHLLLVAPRSKIREAGLLRGRAANGIMPRLSHQGAREIQSYGTVSHMLPLAGLLNDCRAR